MKACLILLSSLKLLPVGIATEDGGLNADALLGDTRLDGEDKIWTIWSRIDSSWSWTFAI